jgi:hypothetical protein
MSYPIHYEASDWNGTVEYENAAPIVSLRNSTGAYTDGADASNLKFYGSTTTHLWASVSVAHDGTSDDYKGRVVVNVNNGSGATEVARFDSSLNTTLKGALILNSTETITASGAVSVVKAYSAVTLPASGALALTLANGTAGQVKVIVATSLLGTGTAVITPTSGCGFSTITLNAAGDTATLLYTASGWAVVGANSAALA